MTFSERLKELRVSRNLTQKQVYTSVGMSALGYQRYDTGKESPLLNSSSPWPTSSM